MRRSDLTPEQLECIEFDTHQHLLIKGPPGSGKTWVLLFRGQRLAASSHESTRFVTFTNALMKHAIEMERANFDTHSPAFSATTFHKWCWRLLGFLSIRKAVISDGRRTALIRAKIEEVRQRAGATSTRVLDNSMEWWLDEFKWIKGTMPQGALIEEYADYEHVSRRGRGSALQVGPRRLVWEVFAGYQEYLASDHAHPWDRWLGTGFSDEIDFDDYARLAVKGLTSGASPAETVRLAIPERFRVDHLLVDESQDFDAAQLLLLVRSARRSVTLVADEAQKIYRTPSVFESLGLAFDVRAHRNVKALRLSFRTTRQIYDLAQPLILDERDPTVIAEPQLDGPMPRLHLMPNAVEEERHTVRLAVEVWNALPTGVVAVLVRSWDVAERLELLLKAQGVPIERIVRERGSALTPGVKLTTLHSAKGLEFDAVILYQVTEGVLPPNPTEYSTEMQHDDEAEFLASERRLLYVGMTRARHILHMTCTEPRSRFLREPYATAYETVAAVTPAVVPADAEADEMINLDEFDDIL